MRDKMMFNSKGIREVTDSYHEKGYLLSRYLKPFFYDMAARTAQLHHVFVDTLTR